MLATLCDLTGVDAPKTNEGVSLVPVLKGEKSAVREVLYGAYCGGKKPGMRSVKKGDWKLIKYQAGEEGVITTQLFNLVENPDELLKEHHDAQVAALTGNEPKPNQVNLVGNKKHAAKLKEMEVLLLVQMKEHDDPYRFSDQ